MTWIKGAWRRSAAIPLVVVVVGGFTLIAVWVAARPTATQILFHAFPPRYTADDLIERAAVVALVRPTGVRQSHWNSASNHQWEAPEGSGLVPMIVTDQQMRVVRGFRGTSDGDLISVRTIGGTVGAIEFVDVDTQALRASDTYLVFLGRDDWRGQDVVERGIFSPLGGMQAIYTGNDQSGYLNPEGLFLSAEVVEDLAR